MCRDVWVCVGLCELLLVYGTSVFSSVLLFPFVIFFNSADAPFRAIIMHSSSISCGSDVKLTLNT